MGLWASSAPMAQALSGTAGPLVDWGNRLVPEGGYRGLVMLSAFMFFLAARQVRRIDGSR